MIFQSSLLKGRGDWRPGWSQENCFKGRRLLPLKQFSWDHPGRQSPRPFSEYRLTLPRHVTLETGYRPFQSLHVAWSLTTRLSQYCSRNLSWLVLSLCVPDQCRCGSHVDSFDRHSLVCKQAPGRTPPSQCMAETRSLAIVGVSVSKEPSGLNCSNGKRPGWRWFHGTQW